MNQAIEATLVGEGDKLRQVLTVIDENGLGLALIVSQHKKLLGLVTDGDIRRALLKGYDLDVPVQKIMNSKPVTVSNKIPRDQVFRLMNEGIRQIPVVDDQGKVCDLVCFTELYKKVPWAIPYIGEEELNEVMGAIQDSWITMGPRVERLERVISDYLGVKHAIAVSSGTAALDVALKALGVGPGDEVILPAFTYIATANSVLYQHARPVLADVDPKTYNVNPEEVIKRITPKTKCIMSIDYGGQSADYDSLLGIAKRHGLYLVEDGAPSLGGEYKGRKLCSFGDISTVSLHAAKVITSAEGGMVLTNDDGLATRARIVRNQGEDPTQKYLHILVGHNYRMTDLHAAVGLAQFTRLSDILKIRAEIATYYSKNLAELCEGVVLPYTVPGNKHAWFLYPILLKERDKVAEYLRQKGIDTRVSWPLPINKQPVYRGLLDQVEYPVAEQIAGSILNLPIYYKMTKEEQDYTIIHLKDAVGAAARES